MDVTARTADDFKRLEDLGATDIVTGFPSEGQDMIDHLRRFGEKIISPIVTHRP